MFPHDDAKDYNILHECLLSQGVRGLYRGYRSTVLREVGESCCCPKSVFLHLRMPAVNQVEPLCSSQWKQLRVHSFHSFNSFNFNSAPIWQLIYCIRVILCICNPSEGKWIACKFFLIRLEKLALSSHFWRFLWGFFFQVRCIDLQFSPIPTLISFIYLRTSFWLLEAHLSQSCN